MRILLILGLIIILTVFVGGFAMKTLGLLGAGDKDKDKSKSKADSISTPSKAPASAPPGDDSDGPDKERGTEAIDDAALEGPSSVAKAPEKPSKEDLKSYLTQERKP